MPRRAPACLDILFVGGLPPFRAGSALSLAQLLAGFAGLGHSVRALTPITPDLLAEGEAFAATQPALNVSWLHLPYLDFTPDIPAPPGYRRRERRELWRVATVLLQARRPDLVMCGHESWGWHVPALARHHGLPCLQLLRGNPIRGILDGTYSVKHGRRLLAELRTATLLVANAEHTAAGLRRLGFDARLVPNAVDLRQFAPRPRDAELARALRIADTDIVVAQVANLKTIKRPLDVVESSALALRREPRLLYLMVGDGVLRAEVEAACARLAVQDRFRFPGWVPYERVPAYLGLADLVVLASEGEGLARAYLEAQASQKVLIASDIPAAREVIESGRTGFLFEKGNPADLADKTVGAAASPRLRAEIGRRARARVQVNALDRAVTAYVHLMREILARPPVTIGTRRATPAPSAERRRTARPPRRSGRPSRGRTPG
jgi:glycosyltransferase involved in cell wall biosynthesis